ncbi:hypothetical protein DLAC_02511 [Tieghemostelium lacteum]|uniref:F-box domain-containing protein n=1 Tax=Tieghemostelium lacteum TaxID=361077 RepID=A0A152A2M2_TIELA|nr:hypothetical protein DLAC_02511 [Tieghemostelium lacteum]|eukprot:KYR00503.1 hypothetical protein DLAC_02511 [Tieghemostelium lacteum]
METFSCFGVIRNKKKNLLLKQLEAEKLEAIQNPNYFNLLSTELLLCILKLFTINELCVIARISHRFKECCYDPTLWRTLAMSNTMQKKKLLSALKNMESTSRLSAVRMINLNNQFIKQATIDYIVTHTPQLKEIRLHNLRLTEKTSKLLVAKCPNLEQVYMDGGRTSDECLELLANGAVKLKSINLHRVENITTTGICHIIKNTNLSFLNFNGISGWDIRTLAPYCAHFTSMDLGSSNNLSDEDLKALTRQCKKLKFISLKSCKLITDHGVLELINDCPQLMDLNLASCSKVTRTSVQHVLQQLHSLTTLNLSNFKNIHPIIFPKNPYKLLNTLTTLDLSYTDVNDDDIKQLTEYSLNLKNLRLCACVEVTDLSMVQVATFCKKLVGVDLTKDQQPITNGGSTQNKGPMKITLETVEALFINCPDLQKVAISYSSKNNITKRSLMELHERRLNLGMKMLVWNLNEDIILSNSNNQGSSSQNSNNLNHSSSNNNNNITNNNNNSNNLNHSSSNPSGASSSNNPIPIVPSRQEYFI